MSKLVLGLIGALTTGTGLAAWFEVIPVNLGQVASFVWIVISILIARFQIKAKKLETAKLKEELLNLRIKNASFIDEYKRRRQDNLPMRRHIDRALDAHKKEFPDD